VAGALRPPDRLLARLRWFFLAFVLFFALTFVPQLVLESDWPVPVRVLSALLLLALAGWWTLCYRRGVFPLAGLPFELAVFVAVVLTPADPFKSLGLLYIAVNFRSFYGSWRQVAGFTALAIATFSAAVLWAPHLGLLDRSSLLPYTLPGVPVLALIAHLVSVASTEAERAVDRERTLSAAGLAIVQAAGAAAVRAEVLAAAGRLLRHVPRASVRLCGPGADRSEPGSAGSRAVVPLPSRAGDLGALVVTSDAPLPAEVAEALQVLAAQASLGLQGAALTADLTYRASHDPLTDLANRAAVGAHLDAVIARRGDACSDGWAVVLLDLDGFKAVNDDLGHAAGDRVLEVAARRLCVGVRDGDLVGRLGGDEFVVVVHGLSGEDELAGLVGRLETSLREPVDVGGRTVSVGASIGTTLVPRGEVVTGSDLLARADAAMYRVKRGRRADRTPEPVG
jgi:diguanylate cyclase (GGDEF)-like protein